MSHTVTGTIILMKSGNDRPKCQCCPNHESHVFSEYMRLPDSAFALEYPSWLTRRLDDWLKTEFDFKGLEGRRIKITATLEPQ